MDMSARSAFLFVVFSTITVLSTASFAMDQEVIENSREVYYSKCFLAIPKSGQMATWGLSEGLGKNAKAARAAALVNCRKKYDELAPGVCDQVAEEGMSWDCQFGVWIPFSEDSES